MPVDSTQTLKETKSVPISPVQILIAGRMSFRRPTGGEILAEQQWAGRGCL